MEQGLGTARRPPAGARTPLMLLAFLAAFLAVQVRADAPKSISEIDYTEYEPRNFNLEKDLRIAGGEGYEFEDDEPTVDVNTLIPVGDADNDVVNRVGGEIIPPRYENMPWHEIFLDAKLIYRKNYRWWKDHPEYRWLILLAICTVFTMTLLCIFCVCYYLIYRYFCVDLLTCDPFEEDIERYCVDDAPTYPSKLQWLEDYCEKHKRCRERGYV